MRDYETKRRMRRLSRSQPLYFAFDVPMTIGAIVCFTLVALLVWAYFANWLV